MSHFEIYLEAMQDMGANISPIVSFFDLQDSGQNWQTALKHARFPAAVSRYARKMSRFAQAPLHERAAALFYEGEPFIPDSFLLRLGQLGGSVKISRLLDYFERHIEGLKRPGFSASGRLVEILCNNDEKMSMEAEQAAEEAMKNRVELWNYMTEQLDTLPAPIKKQKSAANLRLVSSSVI